MKSKYPLVIPFEHHICTMGNALPNHGSVGRCAFRPYSSRGRFEVRMQIYPAIDLRGGKCVRLRQGDYSQETVFGADPAEMATRWVRDGATFLHLVDLDGAREGRPINGPSVSAIVRAAGVPCQLGGGLRS